MEHASASCLGFSIDCGVLLKGLGVTITGTLLFVGSVYVLLSAIFGRWMGYLVLMVSLAGWMILQSALWAFGFWSLGVETPVNLGPRGNEPSWLVEAAGSAGVTVEGFEEEFSSYPGGGWTRPDESDPDAEADLTSVQGAAAAYLAGQANAELEREPTAVDAVLSSQFTIDATSFAEAEDGTRLAAVEAHFTAGGPSTFLAMAYDTGNVAVYSYLFLAGSIVLFAIHLPLLDRAEKKRKEFLTGGSQPAWYGPA